MHAQNLAPGKVSAKDLHQTHCVFLSSPGTTQFIMDKAHMPIAPGTSPAGCSF